jgi:ATP-dependent Clp protease ATP-binding subunit ClpB
VVEIQLRHVSALRAERGYHLVISPEARSYLAEICCDADYGARPLKRAIQRGLQDPLAVKILGGEFHEGEAIHVDREKKRLEFTSRASDKSLILK